MSTFNLHGTVFYLTAFISLLPIQLSIGLQRKTYNYLIPIFLGLCFEVLAYVARILLHGGQEKFAVMYFLPITIAPTFLSIAIYFCMPRIIHVYGAHLSPISPKTYTTTLILSEACALMVQAIGGIVTGIDGMNKIDAGLRIMQVGLAAHIVTMSAFIIPTCIFALNTYKRPSERAKQFEDLRSSRVFKALIMSLTTAICTILVRTCYRVAQPGAGFKGDDETAFLVLDSAMVLIASTALTALHPGVVFRHYTAHPEKTPVRWQDIRA